MFGKILGAIIGYFLIRSIMGAIIGAVAGHFFFDMAQRRARGAQGSSFRFGGINVGSSSLFQRQDLFFQLFFSLLGKMAKIDGSISQEEHIYISKLLDNMKLQGNARDLALQYFNKGSHQDIAYLDLAKQFYQSTAQLPQLRSQLLYQLVGLASADKIITNEERKFLDEATEALHIPHSVLENHIESFGADDGAAYHVLEISPSASDAEVKAAYKTALKEYHPDILKSKGLPPSMMEFAQQRFYDIQNAWEKIKHARGFTD